MTYRTYALQELVTIKYGKNQKNVQDDKRGMYPILGTGGLMGYSTEPLYSKPSVLIGRKGSISKVKYVDEPFWTVDTLFYTIVNDSIVYPKYLYYLMSMTDFNQYNEGTTIPSLRTDTLNRLEFGIPPLKEQEVVLNVLSALDNKIESNNQINDNLEQQAQAIFKSWFIDFEPWNREQPSNWIAGTLGEFVEIKRGGSPRPIHDYLSETGLRWLKISDVTGLQTPFVLDIKEHIKESGFKKTVLLKSGALVLSNSATPGIPKILDVDTCIHDGWLYFVNSHFSNEYLYLFFKHIKKDLVVLGNGSVFTNLKTDILKSFPTVVPDNVTLRHFDETIKPIFLCIKNNTREINSLAALRDTLLPKLMSGELDISDVNI